MADAASPEEVRTGLVADALRNHPLLIAICALLGLALGYVAGTASSTTYTSTATVLINPLLGNPYSPEGLGESLTNLETEAQLVRSDVLANEVSGATGLDPQTLQRNLNVSVPINTQIVEISYTSANAQEAQAVVNDYADGYLAARQDNREAVASDQTNNLNQQIADTQTKLQDAVEKGKAGDPFQNRLAQTLTGQLASLRIQAAQISGSGRNPGEVISPGEVASTPNGISPILTIVGGLILGLVLGALLAISRERSSHVLRHLDQVEHAGLPVLGVFTGKRDENRAAVYRHVRAGLGTRPPATLAVASTTSGAAAGVVAAELALSYTHSPEDVALVDAVGTSSRLLLPDDIRSLWGLSDVLLDRVALDEALVAVSPDAAASVHLLPPGTDVEGGAERYAAEAMTALLASLHSRCGPVLVASPGLCEPDGSSLAAQTDAAMMVIVLDQTTYHDVLAAREWLVRSGTALLGAVVITELGRKSPFVGSGRLVTAAEPEEAAALKPEEAEDEPVQAPTAPPQEALTAGAGSTVMNDSDVASADQLAVDDDQQPEPRPEAQADVKRRDTKAGAAPKTSGRPAPSVPHG